MPDYQDDPNIKDDHNLWRRVRQSWLTDDAFTGEKRPSSNSFFDGPMGPMSVVWIEKAIELGRSAAHVMAGHSEFWLVRIAVRVVRDCGLAVVFDPLDDEPAHALVVGKKTASVKKRLARAAIWEPPYRPVPPVHDV